jgi:hypothetical protein
MYTLSSSPNSMHIARRLKNSLSPWNGGGGFLFFSFFGFQKKKKGENETIRAMSGIEFMAKVRGHYDGVELTSGRRI